MKICVHIACGVLKNHLVKKVAELIMQEKSDKKFEKPVYRGKNTDLSLTHNRSFFFAGVNTTKRRALVSHVKRLFVLSHFKTSTYLLGQSNRFFTLLSKSPPA